MDQIRNMGSEKLGDILSISEELIKKSCNLSLQIQKFPDELFHVETLSSSSHAFFAFPGSWCVDDWYAGDRAFGETEINSALFPCMKSIGNYDEAATRPEEREFAIAVVNQAFLKRFEHVLQTSQLQNQVQQVVNEKRSIIFTGHSTGGAIAVLATIWFLQKYQQNASNGSFLCVTFGSPLIGNHVISHALRRENWSQYFIHFVMRYDILPRVFLAPHASIQPEFEPILQFFNPKSPYYASEMLGDVPEATHLYINVMRNASAVTRYAASKLMGSTNPLLETVTKFVKLSPYRPFGTFIFCAGNGKLVVLKNPEAVLQLLFYSCQLSNSSEGAAVASACLNQHLGYQNELEGSLEMQNVTYFDRLERLPLASDGSLDYLGLSAKHPRLCLRVAGEFEKQKQANYEKICAKVEDMKKEMKKIEEYRALCERSVGYYDAFKIHKDRRDFYANVSRIALTGIWDEIIEMLKRYELPDEFEAIKEWQELGTRFRRLVEPIDIANYYRHSKDEDTGPYMRNGRPKRYRYPERWLEHEQRLQTGSCGESCFWAEVEELHKFTGNNAATYKERDRISKLQRDLEKWIRDGVVGKEVLTSPTFYRWWEPLPPEIKSEGISRLVDDQASMQM